VNRKDFLIEIGCEDLPEWVESWIEKEFLPAFVKSLEEKKLSYSEVKYFFTPRRIIIYVINLQDRQPDKTVEIFGPPVSVGIDKDGKFTQAAIKFANAHGFQVDKLKIKERKGEKVLCVIKKEKGLPAEKVLPEIFKDIFKKIEIPRGMVWDESKFKFIRPVRWLLSLFDGKVVRIEIGNVKSKRISFGHRVLKPESFSVSDIKDYFDKVTKNFVIFDHNVRREFLKKLIEKELPSDTFINDEDISRISRLVEYPVVTKGKIPEKYMELPYEVVKVVIEKLKGIPIYLKNGKGIYPEFFLVFDGAGNEEIKRNYESVLASKLEDASFFLSEDLKKPFSQYSEDLKKISYLLKWGTLYDRVSRLRKICSFLCDILNLPCERILTAVNISKNDLATGMVSEFPELQGVIGRIYAEKEGYDRVIARSIEEQYSPKFYGDKIPESIEGCILSLTDRIEMLAGFFLEGVEISGSGDPFGLKRITNGFIQIIWEKKLKIPLEELVNETVKTFPCEFRKDVGEKILNFIYQRVENLLAGEGISPGFIKSVMSREKDIVEIREKVYTLREFLKNVSSDVLTPFIRISNILKQAEKLSIDIPEFSPSLLVEESEKKLYKFYKEKENLMKEIYERKDYISFLKTMLEWKEPVDRLFDDVLVMCDDEKLRGNRLSLLKKINEIFLLFADFSYIRKEEINV